MNKAPRSTPTLIQMEIAMGWIQRLSEDELSEKDATDWLSWYEKDDANRQAFDQMQALWLRAGALGEGPDGAARIASLESGVAPTIVRTAQNPVVWRDFQLTARSFSARAIGAVVSLLMLSAIVLLYGLHLRESARQFRAAKAIAAGEPAVRHTRLPDGSSIDLASKTAVAVQYTDAQRTLILTSGEAFFSVAPNRSRPFVVKSSGVQIRAVGTQFNVREEKDRVIVTVVKGVVDVSSVGSELDTNENGSAGTLRLNAGNEVTWFVTGGERLVRTADTARTLAWRDGRLDYVNEPLATVISDLNRYSNTKLVVRDPKIAQMTYTGTVFISAIGEWLQAIPGEFPIRVVRESADIALIDSGPATATVSQD